MSPHPGERAKPKPNRVNCAVIQNICWKICNGSLHNRKMVAKSKLAAVAFVARKNKVPASALMWAVYGPEPAESPRGCAPPRPQTLCQRRERRRISKAQLVFPLWKEKKMCTCTPYDKITTCNPPKKILPRAVVCNWGNCIHDIRDSAMEPSIDRFHHNGPNQLEYVRQSSRLVPLPSLNIWYLVQDD